MDQIEIEIKTALLDPEKVKQQMMAKGAILQGKRYQHDILLDPPTADFSKTDQVLRIRNSNGNWKLDYKSPRLDNETKSRREYSLKIDDGEQLKQIFNWMKFNLVGEIEKTRETYKFKELNLHFDTVTNLGTFLEVESFGTQEQFEGIKKEIFQLLEELGIQETIKKDYLELLWEKGYFKKEKKGITPTQLKFLQQ